MSRKNNNMKLAGVLLGVVVFSVVAFLFFGEAGTPLVDGNIARLSFQESSRDISCEAYNELALTKDGVKSTVASGRDGFNPLVDTSALSITDRGAEVEAVHVRLVLLCDGDLLDDSDATTVSGQFQFQLCADTSAGTKCIVGNDRFFNNLSGVATSSSVFSAVPIQATQIQADVPKTIYEGNLSAGFLESLFPEGTSVVLISRMFPQLTFQFAHPTLGTILATQDSFATNDLVYAQYNGLRSTVPDSDGDGIIDSIDQCTGQPEDFNGFQDDDGCPDAFLLNDQDGDGIPDVNDMCANTPAGVMVDNDGCEITEEQMEQMEEEIQEEEQMEEVVTEEDPEPMIDLLDDDDNDGVSNFFDVCPNTPFGALVDGNGCEIPETQEIVVPQETFDPELVTTTTGTVSRPSIIAGIDDTLLLVGGAMAIIIAIVTILATRKK